MNRTEIEECIKIARSLHRTFALCQPKESIELKFTPDETTIIEMALQAYADILQEYIKKENV